MSREIQGAPWWRCLVVWLVATAATFAVLALARGELARSSAVPFESFLTRGCALALAACAVWFWLMTTAVVVSAACRLRGTVPGCPTALRRALLVACGLSLLAPTAPAFAEGDPSPSTLHVLAGLPLPDRPEIRGPGSAPPPAVEAVVVRPGDSLWLIAERSLPRDAGPAEIDARWRAIWATNRELIGPDPDLVHPDARLRLPREES